MSSLLRGTAIVGSLTFLSRILGFVRDLLVARAFGLGLAADAYIVAFRIPNLLRSIFAEGALTSAFVPTFATALKDGMDPAREVLKEVGGALLLVTTTVTIVGILSAPFITDFFAPGFHDVPGKSELCTTLTQIMMPYIIFVSIVALLNSALNAVKTFGASAWAQVLMNIVLIIGAFIASYAPSHAKGVIILSISVLVGGVVQVIAQLPALKRAGFPFSFRLSMKSFAVREVCTLMGPSLLGQGVYQLIIFLNTLLASLLPHGTVSALFYADRVTQFPVGVFSLALSSVLLPSLALSHAKKDTNEFAKALTGSLRFTLFLLLPLSIWIYLTSDEVTHLLFHRGQFTDNDAEATAAAVKGFSVGILAVSCHSLVVKAFFAQKDTLTPSLLSLLTLCCTVCFSLLFMGPIDHPTSFIEKTITAIQMSFPIKFSLGGAGLSLSSSLAAWVVLSTSLVTLHSRLTDFGPLPLIRAFFYSLLAGAAGGSAVLIYSSYAHKSDSLVLLLSIKTILFSAGWLLTHSLFRPSEWKETLQLLSRRAKRLTS